MVKKCKVFVPVETSFSKLHCYTRCSCVAGLSAKLDSCPSLAPSWLLVEGGNESDPTLRSDSQAFLDPAAAKEPATQPSLHQMSYQWLSNFSGKRKWSSLVQILALIVVVALTRTNFLILAECHKQRLLMMRLSNSLHHQGFIMAS